ncbi:MAG: TolB family protein [Sedimentisphaerales bacterium]
MKLLKALSFGIIMLTIIMGSLGYSKTYKIESPVFSPDGQFIIFSFNCGSNEHIYRINTDGTDAKRLTTLNNRTYFNPMYSSDGSKIVFSSIKKWHKNANLYIMDYDGKNIRRLTDSDYSDIEPVFSPDGKIIYFLRARDFAVRHSPTLRNLRWFDIYSINTDGSNLKMLTNINRIRMDSLSVSHDGKKLLVQMKDPNKIDCTDPGDPLQLISVDNAEDMEFIRPNNQKDNYCHPKFSPDGKSILFVRPSGYHRYGYEIGIMDLKTKCAKNITDLQSYFINASFSYDGKKIVFVRIKDVTAVIGKEEYELWLMNSDGSNPKCVEIPELKIYCSPLKKYGTSE